jgi:regulator of replication initiation timing
MSGKTVIESIAGSAERLIAENRKLRGEVGKLEAAREKLRDENRRLASENAGLERRLAVKELAAGFAGGAGSVPRLDRQGMKTARARVSRLMREVDRCIGLLSKD